MTDKYIKDVCEGEFKAGNINEKETEEEVAKWIEKLEKSMFRVPEKDTTMEADQQEQGVFKQNEATETSKLGDDQEY